MYIWLGVLVAFAAASVALNSLSQWRVISSPEHKLRFAELGFAADWNPERPQDMTAFQPVIMFDSAANFPISYEITGLRVQIGDRVPLGSIKVWNSGTTISPMGKAHYKLPRIDVTGLDFSAPCNGHIEVRVRYGRPGAEKYVWSRKWNIIVQRSSPPDVAPPLFSLHWYDQPQTPSQKLSAATTPQLLQDTGLETQP